MPPRWTPSGVRLRQVTQRPGPNWLFVPGGPGLGSETLLDLARGGVGTGSSWLVDLPGDGSNNTIAGDPYAGWPDLLVEAAQALDDVILVGHSTGGMFALSVPELQSHLSALVLVSSAPHAGWRHAFGQYVERHPLPGVAEAAGRYRERGDVDSLKRLTLASAAWNFTAGGLAEGVELLSRAAYNPRAVQWAEDHFDATYAARWTPQTIPVLIVSGAEDRVVDQRLWHDAPGFDGPNVLHRVIADAGHFPWIENPAQVGAAFTALTELLR